jgi:SPP1 family phage portal protein
MKILQFRNDHFESIDKDKLAEMSRLASDVLNRRRKLVEEYGRIDGIPYARYAVITGVGYAAGIAPIFAVCDVPKGREKAEQATQRAKEYKSLVDDFVRHNDHDQYLEITKDYYLTAAAYLYLTRNESNETSYVRFDSTQTVVFYDYEAEPKPLAVYREWTEKGIDGKDEKRIEIITKDFRRQFDEDGNGVKFWDYVDGVLTYTDSSPLYWSEVPIVPFEEPDGLAMFEPVMKLISYAEAITENVYNAKKYNDRAKLILSGYEPEHQKYVEVLDSEGKPIIKDGVPLEKENPLHRKEQIDFYEAMVLMLKENGDARWLLKELNLDADLNFLQFLHEMIMLMGFVPNLTDDSFGSNVSGRAMFFKTWGADQFYAIRNGVFRKSYKRLIRICTALHNSLYNTDYDYRTVQITFIPNTPIDDAGKIRMAADGLTSGLLSQETAISISGVEVDPESELSRIAKEKLRPKSVTDLIALFNAGLIPAEVLADMIAFTDSQKEEIAENARKLAEERQAFNELPDEGELADEGGLPEDGLEDE